MPPATFDVLVRSTPPTTPEGEDFVSALARAFRVERWRAEHIAGHAPIFVKRGVAFGVAERFQRTLEQLGVAVEIRASATRAAPPPPPNPSWPPGLPPDSWHASMPPLSVPSERLWPTPPPRPSMQPAATVALRPTAPPTVHSWKPAPLPPPPRTLGPSTGALLFGGAALLALAFVGTMHWLRSVGDAKMLGNTPSEQTACTRHYGLTGPGLDPARRAKLTLVVAWRTGCVSDDYRAFLRDLGEAHRGELAIVGAGLAAGGPDRIGFGPLPQPPPAPWPPAGCDPGFETLPINRGYVIDSLSAPATYLYDADGALIAAWRGGMSLEQRERLTTWLDGRTWDP